MTDATVTRPYTTADVERLRGSVHVEHTLARLGADQAPRIARGAGVGRGPRRDDRWPGRADGACRARRDLPLRLAGRRRREPRGRHVPRPEPLPRQLRPGARAAHLERAPARRPDRARGGERRHVLAGADRGRCRGRLRRAAQRLRDHEGVHRGGRGRRPLRGPALVGEEVRSPRRQGARADEPVRAHARRRTPRRGRARRPDADRRPDRRALGEPVDERRRRGRPRALHGRADTRGLLPRP